MLNFECEKNLYFQNNIAFGIIFFFSISDECCKKKVYIAAKRFHKSNKKFGIEKKEKLIQHQLNTGIF